MTEQGMAASQLTAVARALTGLIGRMNDASECTFGITLTLESDGSGRVGLMQYGDEYVNLFYFHDVTGLVNVLREMGVEIEDGK